MINDKIMELLRSPGDLKPLHELANSGLGTEDGREFPIVDGILCLLQTEERDSDLGDDKFYEDNPFGERDWTDRQDVESGVEKQLKDILREYSKDSLIIDVGSGPGRISNYLSLADYENVVSLDYSLASLTQVKNNSKNTCIWGNNLHLPIDSDSFDLVISSGVAHHTPDPHLAIAECIRVLKLDGRLYLRVYNIHSLYGYLYYTYGLLLRALSASDVTKFLANLFGFKMYKFVRKAIFSLPDRQDRILKANFGNLFIKKMVYFFGTREIQELLTSNGLVIENSARQNLTHRMHCYVARKQA